ncbi:ABC transporter permease, partial [Actinacidiphila rubida]|uniref:ABC transporter permease n=1 Tax=Actinacidiphila rubida TaxID=310780 RepID=UPI00114CDCA4
MVATGTRPRAVARRAPAAPKTVRGGARHGTVLAAAALAVLLSATVLAAIASLADRSVEGGIQQRLAGNPRTTVQVMAHYRADGIAAADTAIRSALGRVFGGVPHTTYGALRTPSSLSSQFAVLRPDGAQRGASVTLVALPDEARHARLLSGHWPRAAASAVPGAPGASVAPLEVALNRTVAARTGLRTGDAFAINLTRDKRLQLRVSGLWTPAPGDPGVLAAMASTFDTVDSIALMSEDAFTAQPGLTADALAEWIAAPDTARLRLGQVAPLRDRTADFANSDTGISVFHGGAPPLDGVHADSELPSEIDDLTAPMAVARAGIDIPGTLLAALATAALVLTARQLAQSRATEVALMGARGAGTARLVAGTAVQWALVAVPAAAAAPFLVGPLLAGLRRVGLLDGPLPGTAATTAGCLAALLALAVHGAAVLVPTAVQAADHRAGLRLRMRGARAAAFQRAGTDLALAAVAVLGWLQLRQYRTPVASGGVSGVSVDPVLVLAPVLMTTAATLLSLRLLPLAAPLIDRAARRGSGLVLPLGGWQVGRRAARHAGPALLMTLALAVAALSTTALDILDRGTADQAAFATGADVKVVPQPDGGQAPPVEQRHARYAALPGVRAVTPVTDVQLTAGDTPVDLEGVNTAAVAATQRGDGGGPVPAIRSDLTDRPAAALLAELGARIPDHGFAVPGRPAELPLTVRLSADGVAPGQEVPVRLSLTVEDADGLTSAVSVPLPVTDGSPYPVRVPLTGGGGAGAARQYPLRITGLSLNMIGAHARRTYHLVVAAPGIAPEGGAWRDLTNDINAPAEAACPGIDPLFTGVDPPVLCTSTTHPGELFQGVLRGPDTRVRMPVWQIDLAPRHSGEVPPVPALVDGTLAAGGQFRVGDTVTLTRTDEARVTVRIIGRIGAVPGFDRARGRLLVDSRALAAHLAAQGLAQPPDAFWWLSAHGGAAAAALRADPALGAVSTAADARTALTHDPLRTGTRSVLLLSLVLAPAFAVVGFTLHTAMSARMRRREFALLRAIGVRRRQLAALLWTEQLWIALLAVL